MSPVDLCPCDPWRVQSYARQTDVSKDRLDSAVLRAAGSFPQHHRRSAQRTWPLLRRPTASGTECRRSIDAGWPARACPRYLQDPSRRAVLTGLRHRLGMELPLKTIL